MEKKRIIIIHTDAQAHTYLGCAGDPNLKTPHLDALAADGMLCRQAYAANGVCVPSRASMMTGRYPTAHGVVNNHCPLPHAEETLGHLFHQGGFATGYFGKGHYGREDADFEAEGWDTIFLAKREYNAYLKEKGYDVVYPKSILGQNRIEKYHKAGPAAVPREDYLEPVLTREAMRFLEEFSDRDSLTFLSYVAPHGPFTPPEPYASMYDPEKLILPPRSENELKGKPKTFQDWITQNQKYLSEPDLRIMMSAIYGLITMVDDCVGELIQFLKEKGWYDSSVILFTSDHGEFGGHYGIIGKSWCVEDCLIRIPLILKAPDVPAGQSTDALMQNVDYLPTLLDYAGLPIAPKIQGRSLRKTLCGEEDPNRRSHVYSFQRNEDLRGHLTQAMISDGTWKYVENDTAAPLLFNTAEDPHEWNNRAGEPALAERQADLRNRLISIMMGSVGQFYDPDQAGYWEAETCFWDETKFTGGRILQRGTSSPL